MTPADEIQRMLDRLRDLRDETTSPFNPLNLPQRRAYNDACTHLEELLDKVSKDTDNMSAIPHVAR